MEESQFLNGGGEYLASNILTPLNPIVWGTNVVSKIMTPPKDQRRGVRNRGESLSHVTPADPLLPYTNKCPLRDYSPFDRHYKVAFVFSVFLFNWGYFPWVLLVTISNLRCSLCKLPSLIIYLCGVYPIKTAFLSISKEF